MTELNLPPDDLPPVQTTASDKALRRQLETAVSQRLYEACDGVTQSILMSCEWFITINSTALTLIVTSPNASTNLRVLNNLVQLGTSLAWFSGSAKIRICPPTGTEPPFELPVDEVAIYRDSLGMEG